MKKYLESQYLIYSFMKEKPGVATFVDFEMTTDYFYSKLGRFIATLERDVKGYDTTDLRQFFIWTCHMNPLLRNANPVKVERIEELMSKYDEKFEKNQIRKFYHTLGSVESCMAHELRAQCKDLVRIVHLTEGGNNKDELVAWFSILSLYLFNVAYELNQLAGFENIPYTSEVYDLGKD